MTSILEPFLSKRSPNETGTVSVYASVNRPAENNADSFFQVDGETIETGYNISAPQMSVSQMTSDDSVVNKSYVDGAAAELAQSIEESYIRKDTTSLALQKLDITDTRKANSFNFNEVKYTTDDVSNSYLEISHNGQRFVCMNKAADRGVNFINDIGLGATYFIRFNRRIDGVVSNINYPEGALCNLIPSTITSAQINYLTGKELLDNVCPTYQYCESTYAKSSDLASLVVQETGTSTTNVMSQKAVTDAINSYTSDIVKNINLTENTPSGSFTVNMTLGNYIECYLPYIAALSDTSPGALVGFVDITLICNDPSDCQTYEYYLFLGRPDAGGAQVLRGIIKSLEIGNEIDLTFPISGTLNNNQEKFYFGIKKADGTTGSVTFPGLSIRAYNLKLILY